MNNSYLPSNNSGIIIGFSVASFNSRSGEVFVPVFNRSKLRWFLTKLRIMKVNHESSSSCKIKIDQYNFMAKTGSLSKLISEEFSLVPATVERDQIIKIFLWVKDEYNKSVRPYELMWWYVNRDFVDVEEVYHYTYDKLTSIFNAFE